MNGNYEPSKETVIEHTRMFEHIEGRMTAFTEALKALERRFDAYDGLTKTVNDLSVNLSLYAQKNDLLLERFEAKMESFDERQMKQGERIGKLEQAPGARALKAVGIVVTAVLAALGGYLFSLGVNGG